MVRREKSESHKFFDVTLVGSCDSTSVQGQDMRSTLPIQMSSIDKIKESLYIVQSFLTRVEFYG